MRPHPGSSWEEILNEPNWADSLLRCPGHKDQRGRYAGSTHDGDECIGGVEREEAREQMCQLRAKAEAGELLNFRNVMSNEMKKEVGLAHGGFL